MLPVEFPDFLHWIFLETRQVLRVVHIPPWSDVMDTANQIIPRSLFCESFDPRFIARYKVAFETKPDRETGRLHLFDHVEVSREFL
jgi:hypothetical protein